MMFCCGPKSRNHSILLYVYRTIALLNVWWFVLSGGVTGLYVCILHEDISKHARTYEYNMGITQLATRSLLSSYSHKQIICGKRKMNGFFEFGGLAPLLLCVRRLFGFLNQGGH